MATNGSENAGAGEADAVPEALGRRIRHERQLAGLTVRGLAARIEVSPSLISQVERGRATPSVATLWAIARELGIPVGDLFADRPDGGADSAADPPVQRHATRRTLTLESGVRWERLTPGAHDDVDFVYVVYPPGAESCRPEAMTRHGGTEYGFVLSGSLAVEIGGERHVLEANDSIRFEAQVPHRLWTVGSEPATAVWAVLDRRNALSERA